MLELDLPQGTSVKEALMQHLPSWHRQAVPPSRDRSKSFSVVLDIQGRDGGKFSLTIRGNDLTVTEGLDSGRDLWIATDTDVARFIVEDMGGAHRIVPRSMPSGAPVQLITDPLLLEKVLLSQGIVHFALRGVPGAKKDVWAAMGIGKRHARYIDFEEPDLRLEVPYELFKDVAVGKMQAQRAISTPQVRLKGSRMLAMQLALVSTLLVPTEG